MGIGHLTNRTVEVWRTVRTPDGAGGYLTDRVYSHDLSVRIVPASARERLLSSSPSGETQGGADLTHITYVDSMDDVQRGDELRDEEFAERFQVMSVRRPSDPYMYLRAECSQTQSEPDEEGS